MIAVARAPSANMHACQRTYVDCLPIDHAAAVRQHAAYCQTLRDLGCHVRVLQGSADLPDCAFIEDTAVVLDEVALLTNMGAQSRAAEPADVVAMLSEYRPIERMPAGATLEGGDVLRLGRTLLVGQSRRTNAAGRSFLTLVANRLGYQVRQVPVTAALHLKTGCTALPDGRLLVNRRWLDVSALGDFDLIGVPEGEPWGANLVVIEGKVVMPASAIQTAELLVQHDFEVVTADISEFAKAEGGVTCLSLLFSE